MSSFDKTNLLGASILGHSLSAFTDSVLGKFSRQQETNRSLNLATRDGGTAVVVGKLRGFIGDPLEDVVDKRVHDAHGLAGDAGVWMDLLEDFVDVDGIGLLPLLVALGSVFSALLHDRFLASL